MFRKALAFRTTDLAADDSALKKLDSSVKRNTALVKKLRQANEETRESLLEEVRRTNQSKVRIILDLCLRLRKHVWTRTLRI